jgi:ABC-2 type transport system permease protein
VTVFAQSLRNQKRALVAWFMCLAATGALIVASFSQMAATLADYQQLLEAYPREILAFLGIEAADMGTAAGFLRAELSSWIPAVVLVFAVLAGAKSTAAEEESGQLDLLLAAPISRTNVMLQKIAALAVSIAVVVSGLWAGVQGAVWATAAEVAGTAIAAEMVQIAAMSFGFGALALLVGALTGRRGLSAGVAGAAAAASYLLHSLSGIVEALEPWRWVSLYYYYAASAPIMNGLNAAHLGVLIATSSVFGALAIWTFNRRDIST